MQIVMKNPADLQPYLRNSKMHPPDQIRKIAGQIQQFGFDQPIVVTQDNVIVKGHGRREAALLLGLAEVPVVVTGLTIQQAMASRIGDNKVAESDWNYEHLKVELTELQKLEVDMDMTGFDFAELDSLLRTESEDVVAENGESINDLRNQFHNSTVRQIVLMMDQEKFAVLMQKLLGLQQEFQLTSNTEVVEKLVEFYESRK